MHEFHPPKHVVELALEKAKQDGVVHPDARFNYEADRGLRREVTYRDYDLQFRLSRSPEEEAIVEAARQLLVTLNLIPANADYDRAAFDALRKDVKEKFKGTWSSITPVMERLVYMLTAVKRPRRMVELGSFWGNTLAWFAGPAIGSGREYEAEMIRGVEIDLEMTRQARENFSRLDNCEKVELIGEDAATALYKIDPPIDMLYLEAKDEKNRNGYLEFLRQAYDKLSEGAWVIAHDSNAWAHQEDMKPYLAWVRDKSNFSESISFDIDQFGLELSIK